MPTRKTVLSNPKLVVWPLHELSRVFPHDMPPRNAGELQRQGWSLAGARGEYIGAQLGVYYQGKKVRYTGDITITQGEAPLSDLNITASPFRSGKEEIASSHCQIRWVGLVPLAMSSV